MIGVTVRICIFFHFFGTGDGDKMICAKKMHRKKAHWFDADIWKARRKCMRL
jgi:hypothetical protein